MESNTEYVDTYPQPMELTETPETASPPPNGWARAAPPGDTDSFPTEPPTPADVAPPNEQPTEPVPMDGPPFILYKAGPDFGGAVADLALWVNGLLVPVYCREISSTAPWCPRWYEHMEAIAQLYGLWMAWQELTGFGAPLTGPAMWHRDFLMPAMNTLRDPAGIFAGCKPGQHRRKEPPPIEEPEQTAPLD
ncbi:DUF4913 domain-containing protein [Streptomyces sp. NPDC090106]|uniref:DUF4913 domain-containing protein n=1 Tax=Streptomyces sp. NPDC090106 TaxID=3365946 RepID=UPI0037FA0A42